MRKILFLPILLLLLTVLVFFKDFILKGYLPIPSDTIIGLYHPFRDLYAKDYPSGIPFKNFLITDPVRQQYPWRELGIELIKKGQFPTWNPYAMAGYPLLANQQSALLYPLNIFFLFLPFAPAWSFIILLEPLLAGVFLYLYLRNLRISPWASFLGAISYAFCGFSIAWLEWGTIVHVGLWLPLGLLSIDKIFFYAQIKKYLIWAPLLVFSFASSLFAGHLQTFFYFALVSLLYFIIRWWQYGRKIKTFILFTLFFSIFVAITTIQWAPTMQLIFQSAREMDQSNWQKDGWFIPWQQLVQFIAPDFFGNPTTLNYWGQWNYAEFIGYIGIVPLIFAAVSIISRKDKKTLFFATVFFLSLFFTLPTAISQLPFRLQIPLLATAQPTRLLFLVDFSLAVLAAFGMDYFLRHKTKTVFYPLGLLALVLAVLWATTLFGKNFMPALVSENLSVAKQNLFLPTALFLIATGFLTAIVKLSKTRKTATLIMAMIIVAITIFDLLRFGLKFTPFTNRDYLFPQTQTIAFLQKNLGNYRIMAADDRILPPNFSVMYRLYDIAGYDPLYLSRYGELIAVSERRKPDIKGPFGFNRIITPKNVDSKIVDLLGVKYILSLSELALPKLAKVFQEGETRVYENKNVFPRAFFVKETKDISNGDKQSQINAFFDRNSNLVQTAVVETTEKELHLSSDWSLGKAEIISYKENSVTIQTENLGRGFLVLTDSYYPTWHADIDGAQTAIFRSDYNFRGIIVPQGTHTVRFYVTLL